MPRTRPESPAPASAPAAPRRIAAVSFDFDARFARIVTREHGAPADAPAERHDYEGRDFERFAALDAEMGTRQAAGLMLGQPPAAD